MSAPLDPRAQGVANAAQRLTELAQGYQQRAHRLEDELESAQETIEVLEGLISELLEVIQAGHGLSLYEAANEPGRWYFLYSEKNGAIGHRDLNPLLLPFLKESTDG